MRIIIEGWRFLPHSYAIVNRGLGLELARRPGIEVFFRDVPFANGGRHIPPNRTDDPADTALALLPEAPSGMEADVTLRIFVPVNLLPAPAGRTLVFATSEFALYDARQIATSSLAALNARQGMALFTPSQWSRSGLIRGGADPDKVAVVPHGFDPDVMRPSSPARRTELRQQFGWHDKFVFLNIGAMTANKGIFDLLTAFAMIAGEFPGAYLALKGLDHLYLSQSCVEEYQTALPARQRRLIHDRIIYLGKTLTFAQTAQLYQAADAYVSPYRAEAFNLPVLEAAACGLPVICTAGGSTDEFTDRSFALRIPSKVAAGCLREVPGVQELRPEVTQLAAHMRWALIDTDLAPRCRSAGPAYVGTHFTWERVTDGLLALLTDNHALAWQARPWRAPVIPPGQPASRLADLLARAAQHFAAGQHQEVQALCRQMLRMRPLHPEAMYLLGALAMDMKQPDEAVLLFHHAATLQPEQARYHNALGEACSAIGRLEAAEESFREAVRIDPTFAQAHNALGQLFLEANRLDEAERAIRAAVAVQPDYERAHLNLGRVLHARGQPDAAIAAFKEALRLKPDYSTAHNNLGAALNTQRQFSQAMPHFRRALELQRDYPEAYFNLGVTLAATGDPAAAATQFASAIRLRPNYARAHSQLAQALVDLGQVAAAEAPLQSAVRLRPNDPTLHRQLGEVQRLLGKLGEARTAFDAAIRLHGDDVPALASRVYARLEMCDWNGLAADCDRLWQLAQGKIASGEPCSIPPMYLLSLPWSAARQLAIARSYARSFDRFAIAIPQRPAVSPIRPKRLRIGYLSRDLYDHPIGHLLSGLFAKHDRQRFEVHVYSFGPDDASVYRRRCAEGCERFHDVAGQPLEQLDAAIRTDGIDILIDLMGYTGLGRTACLARRPAPIQAQWLGYAGTMGAPFIDYILGDPVVTPAALAVNFSEQIVRLPHSYMPTNDGQETSHTTTRTQHGLPTEGVVFCCFNNAAKIEPIIFERWMNVLHAVQASVAWLSVRNPTAQANLRREAAARNIDPGRLVFAAHVASKAEHLGRMALADLFLDTSWYNAHATAVDCLWAGVPLLTCPGETFSSRVAASLLTALGMPELIAANLDQYENTAIELARDKARQQQWRQKLIAARGTAPLWNTTAFTCGLERAYDQMWQLFATGQEPRAIDVERVIP